MENPVSQIQVKTDQIKRLLEGAIPNGVAYAVGKWRDWIKYEVVRDANKSFLCVSDDFFAYLDEAEISKRFEREGAARAMQNSPNGRFILTRDGLQSRSCEEI